MALFDCPSRDLVLLECGDLVGLKFDLIELFDRPAFSSVSIVPPTDADSLNFDLIELFDVPSNSNLRDGIDTRHSEIVALVARIARNFDNLAPIDRSTFAPQIESVKRKHNKPSRSIPLAPTPQLSVRVALDRLDRMNNVIGELAIERHGLALYNDQVRDAAIGMRDKCEKFQSIADRLQQLADNLLLLTPRSAGASNERLPKASDLTEGFDVLELDRYSELHGIAQETSEQIAQIQEQIEDLDLFSTQSDRQIERQNSSSPTSATI
ncbi:MAG: hypothetical protein HC778_08255 [Chamaesiphon sp. CSU_1_12]|nr:hypothetical protein [Chamaesiphon sp. CSU_1_12]